MDEFDEFDPEGADGDFPDLDDDGQEAPGFDEFDTGEVPDEDGLDAFAFDDDSDIDEDEPLDETFGVDAEYEEEAETSGDETAYAATYEDLLLDEADNPPTFPPELDLDVPEPVDGYPWVDLDALGSAEAEPWVNTVDASEYAIADIDDPAAQALARFWQG
ncbi:hypothetical protein [Glycomyces dulcitolivorans]|uniref:hypothetical protein n=1 Tax=Glycomyces dulcitolivorans TaxID=2200759 RepID=UPI000DD2CC68|nr:hypothetical protein [Glycomyces dulcitolivorans]